MSVLADFTYEGSRSITGPYLLAPGAGPVAVSAISSTGELLGQGLRLVSGRMAHATRHFWPTTSFGYAVQMATLPLPLTAIGAAYAPPAFLGGFWVALVGTSLWGRGMGVQESIIPAVVGATVPSARRASTHGLFTAGYGVAWFLGSLIIGVLYTAGMPAVVGFTLACEVAALPLLAAVRRLHLGSRAANR